MHILRGFSMWNLTKKGYTTEMVNHKIGRNESRMRAAGKQEVLLNGNQI
jgi:hypothetical protein